MRRCTPEPGRALVVVGIHAARVIGVVADLVDVADQVAARIDGLQVAELAIDGQAVFSNRSLS